MTSIYESFYKSLVEGNFESYEDFLRQMKKLEISQKSDELENSVKDFISDLKGSDRETKEKTFFAPGEGCNGIMFFYNICWFYRWLLSDGHVYIDTDEAIENIRKFMQLIKIPDHVIDKIKWAVVFCSFVEFVEKDSEDFFSKIMDKYSSIAEIKAFSDIIDSWMIHHVLLRKREWDTIDTFEEKLLLNYISLVDSNPELEHLFGVAIEIDMEILFNKIKKNEK